MSDTYPATEAQLRERIAALEAERDALRAAMRELVALKDIKKRAEQCYPDDPEAPELLREYSRRKDDAWREVEALKAGNALLRDALWKACGDDEQVVNDTIESQRGGG